MALFDYLALGFSVALDPYNILFCFFGALLGTLIGVLPGLGPVATMAMLLPITFYLTPTAALIMLAGIYYGAQYGGSTTAILINTPGETTSVVTCLDGHAMARKGRAGAALAIAAIGSFFAGTVSTLLIAIASPPLTRVALEFGPAEYFSLMVLGLVGAVVLAHGSLTKALAMTCLGLFLGLVGADVNSGDLRYTFNIPELADGIGFMPIAMGLFGIAEIMANLERRQDRSSHAAIGSLLPSREELRASFHPILRGTALGSALGVLPGGGALLSSFASYTLEKKVATNPARFGNGAIEGVAGPEAANNAGAQTSFIPMLTLGIPSNPVMAMMLGALMIHGIAPGPSVMSQQPALFWGIIASMWIGNLMLIIINLPLVGIWVKLLSIPYRLMFPSILLFCALGVYTVNNSPFEVGLAALCAVFGYLFCKLGCEPAPLLLGFILGPMLEENLRRAMTLSFGDPIVFLRQPISLGLLVTSAGLLLLVVLPNFRRTRESAFKEV